MNKFFSIISAGVLILYPFAIYFGLNYVSINTLALFILALLFIRFVGLKDTLDKMPWLLPATILGALAIGITFISNSFVGFKLYPLSVNLAMFCVFLYSYFHPPCVIETFARITEPKLSPKGVVYTQRVTLLWCTFFIVNGLVSLYTAFYCSMEHWMLYNGFIAYVLMGTLMTCEFLVRLKVKKYHRQETCEVNNKESI